MHSIQRKSNSFSSYSASIYLSIQISTWYQNDSIEFIRLEELSKQSKIGEIGEGRGWSEKRRRKVHYSPRSMKSSVSPASTP